MGFPNRIYLTGFMGSGKSTLGPLVANVLGYDFVDLDAEIEALAGCTVPEVFATQGEAAFRRLEAEALQQMAHRDAVVVSVGGGALTFEANLRQALRTGTVVYLYVALDVLVERLARSPTDRPMINDPATGERLPKAALQDRIEGLLARRDPFYRRAQVIVDVGNERIGYAVDKVVNALRRSRL